MLPLMLWLLMQTAPVVKPDPPKPTNEDNLHLQVLRQDAYIKQLEGKLKQYEAQEALNLYMQTGTAYCVKFVPDSSFNLQTMGCDKK